MFSYTFWNNVELSHVGQMRLYYFFNLILRGLRCLNKRFFMDRKSVFFSIDTMSRKYWRAPVWVEYLRRKSSSGQMRLYYFFNFILRGLRCLNKRFFLWTEKAFFFHWHNVKEILKSTGVSRKFAHKKGYTNYGKVNKNHILGPMCAFGTSWKRYISEPP